MSKTDARIRFTKMVIEDAFFDLLLKKPVGKITVKELCENADINRATFYKHYLDIPDLFEKTEQKLLDRISENFSAKEGMNFAVQLKKLMEYTKNHGEKFMAIGSSNGDPEFMAKSIVDIGVQLFDDGSGAPMTARQKMIADYVIHGGGAILRSWVIGGMKEDIDEVAYTIIELSAAIKSRFY